MAAKKELLIKMAERLRNLDYIDRNFTVENNISADDLADTFKSAAAIIKGVLELPESEQFRIIGLGSDINRGLIHRVANGLKMAEFVDELKKKV